MKRKPIWERFKRFIRETKWGCWIWMGGKSDGYGLFWIEGDKKEIAHRYSYKFFVGPIPENLTIDHACCVKACVNPDHLRLMSREENSITTSWMLK